jgi:hypothetical protein
MSRSEEEKEVLTIFSMQAYYDLGGSTAAPNGSLWGQQVQQGRVFLIR